MQTQIFVLPENHFDISGLIWMIFPYRVENNCQSFPPLKTHVEPGLVKLRILKSNPCSHQVNHGTWVPYQPCSWWANLALRGFSLLKAITADSVSISWLPMRLDEPLMERYLFIILLRRCTSIATVTPFIMTGYHKIFLNYVQHSGSC